MVKFSFSDPIDRTHPDVHDDLLVMQSTNMNSNPQTDENTTKISNSATVATESHPGVHPGVNTSTSVSNDSHPELDTNTTVSKESDPGLSTSATNESHLSMVKASNPAVEKKANLSPLETDIKQSTSTGKSSVNNVPVENLNA